MQETGEGFGGQDEDTEIQNLPLYTERMSVVRVFRNGEVYS